MRESRIELYLVDQVEMLGGDCQKHVSPGRAGVVDRVVALPYGLVWWIETKRPGKTADPLQAYERDKLLRLGQRYALLDTKLKIDTWAAARANEIFNLSMGQR